MTPFIKKKDIKNDWYLVNAENLVVGRLAAYISKVLRGKNKAQFNPNQDNGDFVIVTNIEKIKFAVKRMLPDGPLAKKQLSKLKMYYGDKHPHSTQNPVEIKFSGLNKKNYIKN